MLYKIRFINGIKNINYIVDSSDELLAVSMAEELLRSAQKEGYVFASVFSAEKLLAGKQDDPLKFYINLIEMFDFNYIFTHNPAELLNQATVLYRHTESIEDFIYENYSFKTWELIRRMENNFELLIEDMLVKDEDSDYAECFYRIHKILHALKEETTK